MLEALGEESVSVQFLTFTIAGDEYGVSIAEAREIMQFRTVTRIPTMPPWIRGAINLRGSVVPVIDLRRKFGLGTSEVTKRTCIIILDLEIEGEDLPIGVMADQVNQVVELGTAEISECPRFGTKVQVDFVRGLGRRGDHFVLLLDLDRLLEDHEISAVMEASDSNPMDSEPAADDADAAPDEEPDGGDDAAGESGEALDRDA